MLLVLSIAMAVAGERLADPTRAFVEGYDPSGNDFLANVPERTVLLRIRADGHRLPVEHCKLLEYRRAAATCWQPGLRLRGAHGSAGHAPTESSQISLLFR